MLETLLAIVVITVAGLGVYGLFNSGLLSSQLSDVTDEMVEIANIYTDLSSADLTSSVTDEASLVAVLQNSGRLSAKYFTSVSDGTTTSASMVSAYGPISYTAANAYSFTACVPLGGTSADTTSTVVSQFCNKVQDVYASCVADTANSCQTGQLTAIVGYSLND